MDKQKIRYIVPDYTGCPTSVPADRVEAFLTRQEELKEKVARGEKIELDAESKKEVEKSVREILARYGKKKND